MPNTIASPSRRDAIRSHREKGGQVAAVFPIHYPRALLRAFGLLPVEVWGPPGRDTAAGDAHLQAYTCSIVRSALSFLLDGGLEVAAVLVVPHACDSLQGLGSVLLDFVKPPQPVLPIYIPRGRRKADVEFLATELKETYERLSAITDMRPTDEELHASIDREQTADEAMAELLARRMQLPLSNLDFYRLMRAREYLPAEVFAELASQAVEQSAEAAGGAARIVLSGLVPEPMTVLRALDTAGLTVAADDMACAGRRLYPPSDRADPFDRMAARLLSGPPDSTLGCSVEDRLAHLLQLSRHARAQGLIHYGIKFCEPEQFYLPQLISGLLNAGLRSMALEVDIADPLSDQAVTRLEAFAETLG